MLGEQFERPRQVGIGEVRARGRKLAAGQIKPGDFSVAAAQLLLLLGKKVARLRQHLEAVAGELDGGRDIVRPLELSPFLGGGPKPRGEAWHANRAVAVTVVVLRPAEVSGDVERSRGVYGID